MPSDTHQLSRRERQIMDIIFAAGEATAAEVAAALPGEPSDSTVRTLLRIMEEKGHLKHREEGPRFVYLPIRTRAEESKSALKRVVKTFFEGSFVDAVAALVDTADGKLPPEDLKRIEAIIRKAKSQ
ncbi:MAG: BlaI/MecI/CopY family transcriptional regulator [Verrucomicrobiota bacterium]